MNHENMIRILFVKNEFWNTHSSLIVKNLNWKEHSFTKELNILASKHPEYSMFKSESYQVNDLNNDCSLIKNMPGREGIIEFWPQNFTEEPINIPDNDTGNLLLQYLLFKYAT